MTGLVDEMDLTHDGTLRELETDSGVLRYHEAGEGPPLLLLHGSGPGVSGWRNYRDNLSTFAPHFRCLILEFPGFGVSPSDGQHPMVAAPASVSRFLGALDLTNVDVIGNSMGGVVALNVAAARPELFRRVVTIGGIGRNIFSPAPGEGIKLLSEFAEEPTREALVRWLHSMVYDPATVTEEMIEERWALATDPAALQGLRQMYGKQALAGIFGHPAADVVPYWATLHRVTAPTLITWGRDDRVSPLDMALIPMRTIPHAELHVVPNCGHWTMIEGKEAWESAVLAFLTRPDASS